MMRSMKLAKIALFALGIAAIAAVGYSLSKKSKSNDNS